MEAVTMAEQVLVEEAAEIADASRIDGSDS